MRSGILIFLVSLITILLIDGILYYQLRSYFRKKWQTLFYFFHILFFVAILIIFQAVVSRLKGPAGYVWIEKIIGILFLFYVPKLFFIFFNGIGQLIARYARIAAQTLRKAAALFSLSVFLLLLYGLTWGRYNYKLETVNITFPQLPPAFNDFKIVQLADIHLGSFSPDYPGIPRLVEEVNNLHPDLIVFTGDMVNNFGAEITPWIPVLKQLQAKYGKYAVTGNHDYGDYTRWASSEAKRQNSALFFHNMEAIGFQMLNNTHVPLVIARDTIYLAGVENWGKPPFPQYGNLSQAIDSIPASSFVLLLSHDPSYWRAGILSRQIPLTLSGHTHAMQMGVQISQWKWSPAKYLYPEYDGLYQENNQYLYVSRGQGYLGFPGRIGLRPVITEIILHTPAHSF